MSTMVCGTTSLAGIFDPLIVILFVVGIYFVLRSEYKMDGWISESSISDPDPVNFRDKSNKKCTTLNALC